MIGAGRRNISANDAPTASQPPFDREHVIGIAAIQKSVPIAEAAVSGNQNGNRHLLVRGIPKLKAQAIKSKTRAIEAIELLVIYYSRTAYWVEFRNNGYLLNPPISILTGAGVEVRGRNGR
jgi:hypothetical protein